MQLGFLFPQMELFQILCAKETCEDNQVEAKVDEQNADYMAYMSIFRIPLLTQKLVFIITLKSLEFFLKFAADGFRESECI